MSFHVLRGNALHLPLADESVQCVVTSPPYWGLRDYNVPGQLGLEPTPEEYVANMVAVFREVWRVLRPDGTVWLNLGDSYASGEVGRHDSVQGREIDGKRVTMKAVTRQHQRLQTNLKPKALVGIPWRVAFALQADGWWLRSDIIWHKPNPMPESVTDRPTKAHEYVFLLTKAARYYYDAEAIAEPLARPDEADRATPARFGGALKWEEAQKQSRLHSGNEYRGTPTGTRNRRSVWTIATQPCALAHFATMPPELAETCIKAGTSERGACPACGAPWERVVEAQPYTPEVVTHGSRFVDESRNDKVRRLDGKSKEWAAHVASKETLGFRPTCACPEHEPVPCVVLDPFGGAGTTLMVADRLNRRGVGVELSAEYARMAYNRCYQDAPLLAFAQEALP